MKPVTVAWWQQYGAAVAYLAVNDVSDVAPGSAAWTATLIGSGSRGRSGSA